jgi:hypothetical protein
MGLAGVSGVRSSPAEVRLAVWEKGLQSMTIPA